MKTELNLKVKKIKREERGITLIALVITIIVLLILAAISITMLTGDNSILKRAVDAKTNTEELQIKEKINLAYHSALADGKGSISEDLFAEELTKEFGTRNEKYTLINGKDGKSWTISINGTNVKENITKPTNLQTEAINPEVEYGYAGKPGVVDASSLVEGDIINYYYDKEKEPISCAVLYNDNQHGLQVVALDSVRDVILGYDAGVKQDPKVDKAFEKEIPNDYKNNVDLLGEKCRWSYNHALKTLKEYAMEYIGNMAINAKCIGASDNFVEEDNEDTNMIIANYQSGYSFKYKNSDDGYLSEELNKMDSLNIKKSQSSYWIASRRKTFKESSGDWTNIHSSFVYYINQDGEIIKNNRIISVAYNNNYNKVVITISPDIQGFRPIFLLRDDIQIEKTGHLN